MAHPQSVQESAPIAATARWTRHRRWLPPAEERADSIRLRPGTALTFPLPYDMGIHPAGPVRCPAVWDLQAHPRRAPARHWTLTLINATALGEGYHQLHARLDDGTALRALTGLARLHAPDAASWLLTTDLEVIDHPSTTPPDRITLSALLLGVQPR
ncbi:hypothetical protein ACFWMX_30860 [Streptomyces sp. NPDC058378]|uniref:hypothetical protein n=1 Tax=Streptomyces sp. NPDC058378 TaxID=3346469 RepID=UPI00364D26A2